MGTGQEAINALAFPEQAISIHRDLNKWAKTLFAAAIEGDYTLFAQELEDAARAERFRLFINRLTREEGIGRIQQVEPVR